ncbi:MAG: hypothetical protein ACLUAR_08895 [Pilosibacter sp.]
MKKLKGIVNMTVQQVCALCCADRKKLELEGKNPIGGADLEWIFAGNCEGTEPSLVN